MTTDIHSELDALPPFSNPVAYRDTWQAGCELMSQDVAAYRTRLALAERLLKDSTTEGWCSCSVCEDARDYLAFREKERVRKP